MTQESLIFLAVEGGVVLILVIINVILFWYSFASNRKIDVLLQKGKIKDLKDVIYSEIEKNKNQDKDLKDAFERIKNLENTTEKTFQKLGVVRFNPFSEMGGNQSFVIALLDNQNNGFVISSLFIKEGNRVYTKPIKNGKSDHALSDEEKEAIERAISGK